MIIKSICRRYERWNPVHPTAGAFWGMGVGIGCGVGWGPGFGPEVIGYVGAGCGVGFSVGFTLLGIGIGLPANYLLRVPHNAFMVTRRGAFDFAQVLGNRSHLKDRLGCISSYISDSQQNQEFTDMKSLMATRAKYITDSLQRFNNRIFPWNSGSKS